MTRSPMRLVGLCTATLVACTGGGDEAATAEDAVTSPAGVEFVPMPVDSTSCNATVLRGTRRFAGRGYVLPQAYVGTNIEGRPLFEVIREGTRYKVRLGMYFHSGGAEDVPRALSNRNIKRSCRNDELKVIVNQSLPPADRIATFQPLPVNDVKVSITDTVKNVVLDGTITGEPVSMLGYAGQDHVFEFSLPDRDSYDGFVKRLRGSLGVPIVVRFMFSAQQSEALSIKVDFSSAQDTLTTEFSGAPTSMTRAAFRAKLGRVLSQMRVEVYVDGTTDAFSSVANRIIDQVVVSNPGILASAAPDAPATPNEQVPAVGDDSRIQVSAALNVLRARKTFELKLENAGTPVPLAYGALTSIRADEPGADAQEFRLYTNPLEKLSGLDGTGVSQDWGVWGRDLEAGRTLRIIPLSRRTYEQRYTYATTYFRHKDEITNRVHHQSMTLFPEVERDFDEFVEPTIGAENERVYKPRGYWSILGQSFWGYQDIVAEDVTQGTLTRFSPGAIQGLNFLRVTVDNSGTSYALSELDRAPGPWKVTIDAQTNTVTILAKERIERLKVTNRETFEQRAAVEEAITTDSDKSIVRRRYFREDRGPFGGWDGRSFIAVGKAQKPPALRSEIAIMISATDPPQRIIVTDERGGLRNLH